MGFCKEKLEMQGLTSSAHWHVSVKKQTNKYWIKAQKKVVQEKAKAQSSVLATHENRMEQKDEKSK